ncbi:MAG: hypothetical protein NUV48_07190 [Peptococcaceae bacterium]|jgi:hypothetical protein|nr:hypothetical protein [Peptococcaceae bacterium]
MDFVEKRIREEKEKETKRIDQALARTPREYHEFILLLKENKKLFSFEAKLNDELKDLGAWANKEGTFLTLQQPYMSTAGRTLWWMKEHQKEDGSFYKFEITSNLDDLCRIIAEKGSAPAQFPLVVRVNSEKFGVLEDVSAIFWGGSGANKTNPVENAYTSALGRIYGRVGIGLLGTGVASAEEVENALRQQGLLAGSEPASNALPKAVGGEDAPLDRSEGGKVLQMPQRDTFTVIGETRLVKPYRMARAVNSAGEEVAIAVNVNKGEFSKGSVITGTYQVSEPPRGDQPARLIVVPTSIENPKEKAVEEAPATDASAEAPAAAEKPSADAEITVVITSDPKISGKYRTAYGRTEDGQTVKIVALADAQEFKNGDRLTAPYESKNGKTFLNLPVPKKAAESGEAQNAKAAEEAPLAAYTPTADTPAEEAADAPVEASPAEETSGKPSADAEKKSEPARTRRELVLTAASDAKIRQMEPNPPACYFDAREGDHEGVCLVYMEPGAAEVFGHLKTVQPGDRVKGIFEEVVGIKGYNWNVVEFHGITRG